VGPVLWTSQLTPILEPVFFRLLGFQVCNAKALVLHNRSFDEECPKSCFPHRGLHRGIFHVVIGMVRVPKMRHARFLRPVRRPLSQAVHACTRQRHWLGCACPVHARPTYADGPRMFDGPCTVHSASHSVCWERNPSSLLCRAIIFLSSDCRHSGAGRVAARPVGSGRNRQHNRIRTDPQTCARSCSARTLPRRPVPAPPFPPLPPIHLTPPTRPRLDLAFEDGIPRYGGGSALSPEQPRSPNAR